MGVKSRKVLLSVSNQLTHWICQSHKLRKKIVELTQLSGAWNGLENLKNIRPDAERHKETPRMHFLCWVGSYFNGHLGRLTNAYITELTQSYAFPDVDIKNSLVLNWPPTLMWKYLKMKEKHLSYLGLK